MPGFSIPTVAVSSSSCDGPPISGTERIGPSNNAEFAREHRYLLEVFQPFTRSSAENLLLFSKSCNRPSTNHDVITIHNGQDEIYRPGKVRWNPLDFTFYEAMGPGNTNLAAELIYDWWANNVYDLSKSRQRSPRVIYKNAYLSLLDGGGTSIWMYQIEEAWPTKVTPSDLSAESNDIGTITLTLRFNKCRELYRKP